MSRCKPEYVKDSKKPEEVADCLQERFGEALEGLEIREYKGGVNGEVQYKDMYLKVKREKFIDLVDTLMTFDFLHFQVMSGNDDGEVVTLNYHCTLFRSSERGGKMGICISVAVPKDDLRMPSLWSRIPGVEYSEREMREMLGVDFEGLPNKGLIFLPEDWDEDIKPWRRDDAGPSPEDVRELS